MYVLKIDEVKRVEITDSFSLNQFDIGKENESNKMWVSINKKALLLKEGLGNRTMGVC